MSSLDARWQAFARRPYPERCAGDEVNGVCLASVDTFAAGCIVTFLTLSRLDSERLGVLAHCSEQLQRALPALSGEAAAYFTELAELARQVLDLAGHRA
jgi:hypothetical protein